MKTIEFLSSFPNVSEGLIALESFGIKAKLYPEYNTILLNYDQIESDKNNPIVRECRSLVIDYDLNVVSRSFDRFLNLGEGPDPIDWSSAVAFEKLDGSIIGLYWNQGQDSWVLRTRGTAFAEAELPSGKTYLSAISELFVLPENSTICEILNKDQTFIFEFVSPENRIVTRYQEPALVWTGLRDNKTGQEYLPDEGILFSTLKSFIPSLRLPRSFPVNSPESIKLAAQELENLEEGFVVVDKNFSRVKVKSDAYLVAHRIRGEGLSPKRAAELVAISEEAEYLSVFPEDSEFFKKYIAAREMIISLASLLFASANTQESQKDFAILVKNYVWSALLFSARKNNTTILHEWAQSRESYRVSLILGVACQT